MDIYVFLMLIWVGFVPSDVFLSNRFWNLTTRVST